MGNAKHGPAAQSVVENSPPAPHTLAAVDDPMMPSTSTPKIPLWIFIVTDVALLAAGLIVAAKSPTPLSTSAVFAVVACVIAGAIVLFIPLVSSIEREKNEALDDRQRALEALAATIATSAEQIGIATQGQHTIAELAQKNLTLAESLPARFQDKIAEFESLLNNAQTDEREELKRELARLRASESERLDAIAEKVERAARELAKLEAAAQKHLSAAQAALASAPEALTAATTAALARISASVAPFSPAATPPDEPRRGPAPRDEGGPIASPITAGPSAAKAESKAIEEGLHIVPIVPPTTAPFEGNLISTSDLTMPPFGGNLISSSPLVASSPAATPPDEPHQNPTGDGERASEPDSATLPAPITDEPKPVRKRAPRKPKPVETVEPALVLDAEAPSPEPATPEEPSPSPAKRDEGGQGEFNQIAPDEAPRSSAEVAESVMSSDSATRLLVTAYIGIGNRLFIRGDGPGLSWEKGVPLQFVSIGKWRWETNDATAPVKFKLYKNDELECTALGSQSLNPEHQQEITATF